MTKQEQQRQKIADYALSHYRQTGFSKIPMDDIARGMKISKKTIYKYYDSKDELVEVAFRSFMLKASGFVSEVVISDSPSVVKLALILRHILKESATISNKFLSDLQNDLPMLWKEFDDFRSGMMRRTIPKIFDQGIKEGFVREAPVAIVVTVFIAGVREILKNEFLEETGFTMNQAMGHFYKFILGTILTEKGKEEFSNMLYGVFQNEKY
jgi:AcrR family transcriptional regulator